MYFHQRALAYGHTLSETEQELLKEIFEDRASFMKQTITDFATQQYVNVNTVVRLAKKLQYESYSDMKYHMQQESTHKQTFADKKHTTKASIQLVDAIDEKKLSQILKAISTAKVLHFIAQDADIDVCKLVVTQFRKIGKLAIIYDNMDELNTIIQSSTEKTNVLIALGLSKKGDILSSILKTAQQKKWNIITLTHLKQHPFLPYATYPLYCFAPPETVQGVEVIDYSAACATLRFLFTSYIQYQGMQLEIQIKSDDILKSPPNTII